MQRRRIFSGAVWESKVGYCRALRVGNQIYIAGTAPIDEGGGVFAPGDAYAQTKRCFEIIRAALQDLGADYADVVRTRMYVTDISRFSEFGQAHQECFENHPPVATMVEVKALIDPAMLVEVEVEAVCESGGERL